MVDYKIKYMIYRTKFAIQLGWEKNKIKIKLIAFYSS